MRLPAWLRVRRWVPTFRGDGRGSVSVTIEADVSRFVAACQEASESLNRLAYRRRIRREWSLAQTEVNELLDGLCRRWGMDPVEVWRRPREQEERDRRDRALLWARERATLGLAAQGRGWIIVGGSGT